MRSTTRVCLRRICQGLFLTGFFVLFLILVHAPAGTDQLAYQMRFRWSPAFILCLADPLASLSAFIASRSGEYLIIVPLVVAALCLVIPRLFCSHICPLGTLIDLAGMIRRNRREKSLPRLKFIKYGLLAAVVLSAVLAIPVTGLLTPLPMLTRAVGAAAESAARGISVHVVWLGVLFVILSLSLVHRRFWCNYLCPTGAFLSLLSRLSLRRRTKTDACVECGRCARACSFDAVDPGTFEAGADCAYCGGCARVCERDAIRFGPGAAPAPLDLGRREFVAGACVTGGLLAVGGPLSLMKSPVLLRPPGALPEEEFLSRCLRCGQCALNCPGPAIAMAGLEAGLAAYGTPVLVPERAGCSPDCNNCGRVCPTGAIRHLSPDEKNIFVIGIARYCKELCLPLREDENCLVCYDICNRAGHKAIELEDRIVYLDDSFDAPRTVLKIPRVNPSKCTGCGLCVMACMEKNVRERGVLPRPAVRIEPKTTESHTSRGSRLRKRGTRPAETENGKETGGWQNRRRKDQNPNE